MSKKKENPYVFNPKTTTTKFKKPLTLSKLYAMKGVKKPKAKPQPKIVQVKESPWVRLKVPMSDEQVVRYVGEPCEEFEPRCAACKAWAMWSVTGEIPVSVDREKFFAKLFFGELD